MPTRNTHIDPKQRNSLKLLQTHNLPTDYVENIKSTNKRRNLLLTIQAVDYFLRNRKDAAKDPDAEKSYFA